MRLLIPLALIPLSAALAQSPPRDADTMRDLLLEVRALRLAIQNMTAASQRVQIVLHKLQSQEGVVNRAAQRVEAARNQRAGAEMNIEQLTVSLQRTEHMISEAPSETARKQLQEQTGNMKQMLDQQNATVQKLQAQEAEAASELRNEQAKLSEVQSQLDKLDRALAQ